MPDHPASSGRPPHPDGSALFSGDEPAPLPGASEAEEAGWRARLEATGSSLRERFDEPIEKAGELTRRTLAWFPVRVWRHFLRHNGFLLAAGISYQSLFAVFAVLYVAFAAAGFWLGASADAMSTLIALINRYIPNLISEKGLVRPDQVEAVAEASGSTLLVTGIVAFLVAVWTAIGFITYARRAVRDIFGLPYDARSYLLLKARDLIAAFIFGIALVVGAALGSLTTWALRLVFDGIGWGDHSIWWQVLARAITLIVGFAVNSAALAALYKFLSGTSLHWRTIWPGSLIGGAALAVLQVGAGLLLSYTPANPLLATFAVLVGFLLWFRLNGIVLLVSSAWIAVTAKDNDIPLQHVSAAERAAREHAALQLAAAVRLRGARQALLSAPWWRRVSARRAVREAAAEVARLHESAPPVPGPVKRAGFWD